MTFISVVFLVLELMILAVGILMGYRRGIGRSMVRLAYLIIIGIAAFFLGRFIASQLSSEVMQIVHGMLPSDIEDMLSFSPELEPLLRNIVAALLTPLLFAALFGILQLLSLICFKRLSGKIVSAIYKKQERLVWSKWAGAAVGLVMGMVVSAALLAPLFTVLHVVDSTSDQAITIFAEAYAENGTSGLSAKPLIKGVMKAQPIDLGTQIKPSFDATKFSPWNVLIANLLTSYNIHERTEKNTNESLIHSLPLMVEMTSDALYAYNFTAIGGGKASDALTNAAAMVIPYLDGSETIKYISSEILTSLGKTLQSGGTVLGLSLPESDNPLVGSMINNLVDAIANTTEDTVKDNMITLFGLPTIAYEPNAQTHLSANEGLLATMMEMDSNDPMSALAGSNAAMSLVGALAENDNMSVLLDDIREYTTDMIEEKGIDLSDSQYSSFYNDVKQEITTQITSYHQDETATITDVAKDIESTLGGYLEEHGIPVDELQVSVVAVCIAKEFSNEEYIENGEFTISTEDIMSFFGIDEADIPAWAH